MIAPFRGIGLRLRVPQSHPSERPHPSAKVKINIGISGSTPTKRECKVQKTLLSHTENVAVDGVGGLHVFLVLHARQRLEFCVRDTYLLTRRRLSGY